MVRNSPNRFTTPTQPCWTTLRQDFRKTTMKAKMKKPTTATPMDIAAEPMIMATTSLSPL